MKESSLFTSAIARGQLWFRSAALAAGAQFGVQALGFLSGILIVRTLSATEYGFYTIGTATLGAMTVLADGGVTSGVLTHGGRHWADRARLGAVIATGRALRRQMAAWTLAVAIPSMVLLLRHQGASWVAAMLIAASIAPAFLATAMSQLLEAVPRLHQNLGPLQRIQLASNIGRLAIIAMVLPLWPLAAAVTAAPALPQWIANRGLRRLADVHADSNAEPDPEIHRELVLQLRRTSPGSIYYALSGQLTVWLVALFGQGSSVAAVGALGRLAVLFAVIGSVFSVVAVPRFARMPGDQERLISRRYWQSLAMLAGICSLPVALLAVAPGPVLAILGPHYQGLGPEAVLMAASSVAATLAGTAFTLASVRGIVMTPVISIPASLAAQALLVALLPLSSVSGVLCIGLLSALFQFGLHAGYFWWVTSRGASR